MESDAAAQVVPPTTTTTTTERPKILTIDDEECKIPFIYEGKTYYECTDVGSAWKWCSLDTVYEGNYGYCA